MRSVVQVYLDPLELEVKALSKQGSLKIAQEKRNTLGLTESETKKGIRWMPRRIETKKGAESSEMP